MTTGLLGDMPNVWGPGQLLAFSGIDGPTSWLDPLVLHTGARPGDLDVLLPFRAEVRFEGLDDPVFSLILGDAIVADSAGGRFSAAFLDYHTLIGELPAGVRLAVPGTPLTEARLPGAVLTAVKPAGEGPTPPAGAGTGRLFAAVRDGRWVLHLLGKEEPQDPVGVCHAALDADLGAALAARSAFVRRVSVPAVLGTDRGRLLRKAVSVMKVNIEAPCGVIRRRWTTPDRWPHRHMWLWDSAFHAVGLASVDPGMAKDAVLAMLEQVQPDGMLPHMVCADGKHSEITQPPLLAWATLTVLEATGDRDWAGACLPYLQRYLDWIRVNRDENGNHIPEWHIEGSPLCRCGESGLDNSSVYDKAVLLDAPDFGSFLCHDYQCLAGIAARLGQAEIAAQCRARAEPIADAVRRLLWSPEEQFFFHRQFGGQFIPVKAVSGFMPLFAAIATRDQAAALCAHLRNPATFAAPQPVPSEALDSGTFCKDMWRGPAWLNLSYLICLGLRRYGYEAEAAVLKEKLLAGVERWYAREGCLWEYYDSLDVTPPRGLDRKQRLISGKGIAPISDYHWTAAVVAALLLE